MDGPEKRVGERRLGLPDRREGGRAGNRRMGDRRLSVDENLDMYKRQCENNIDDFAAKLRGKEMPEHLFNQIVNRAKSKLQEVWNKYKTDLTGAESETEPAKEKAMLKTARDDFENATRAINSKLEQEFELLESK